MLETFLLTSSISTLSFPLLDAEDFVSNSHICVIFLCMHIVSSAHWIHPYVTMSKAI